MFNHVKSVQDNVLNLVIKGKVTTEDYQHLYPVLEDHKNRYGNLRFLLEIEDFHWTDARAVWEDIKMDGSYLGNVEKIAVLTHEEWIKNSSQDMSVITPHMEVKIFKPTEREQALDWLKAD